MIGYKKSPTSTYKINQSSLETAHKSSYQEFSPSRVNSPTLKSQSHVSNRIQEAKSTINSIIYEVSGKQNTNNEATQRVRLANADALGFYRQNQNTSFQPQIGNRNLLVRPKSNIQFGQNETNISISNIAPQNLEQENQYLKKTLNQQIQENHHLIQRIKFLQTENNDLRGKLGMIGSKRLGSTNHNSVNYGDVSNNGFRSSVHSPPTAKFQKPSNHYSYDNQEVYPLNFNEPQHHQHQHINNNSANNILAELSVLKRQNEILRQDAVSLLRKHY